MALSSDFFGDIGGAVSDIFGAVGGLDEASAYKKAAQIDSENAVISQQSTALNEQLASRKIYQSIGTERADTGAAGFQMGGSALDLMRSSVEQGAMTKQIIGAQGEQQALSYQEQAAAHEGQASAAEAKSSGGFLGGLLNIAGAAISLF